MRKKENQVRGARRSNGRGKCEPAVRHADAKHRATAGKKRRYRRENERGKVRESMRMKRDEMKKI